MVEAVEYKIDTAAAKAVITSAKTIHAFILLLLCLATLYYRTITSASSTSNLKRPNRVVKKLLRQALPMCDDRKVLLAFK
jgi:hypothetical protein